MTYILPQLRNYMNPSPKGKPTIKYAFFWSHSNTQMNTQHDLLSLTMSERCCTFCTRTRMPLKWFIWAAHTTTINQSARCPPSKRTPLKYVCSKTASTTRLISTLRHCMSFPKLNPRTFISWLSPPLDTVYTLRTTETRSVSVEAAAAIHPLNQTH